MAKISLTEELCPPPEENRPCYKFRKVLKAVEGDKYQYLTKVVTQQSLPFLKVPKDFGNIPYKDQRLYCLFLDCKAQNRHGVFSNIFSRKYSPSHRQYYRRAMRLLLSRGWATRLPEGISLRSYLHVWRDLEIKPVAKRNRKKFKDKRLGSGHYFAYYKIDCSNINGKPSEIKKQIGEVIKKMIAERKSAQIRWMLNKRQRGITQATFGASATALLFGYHSAASGSKLRDKYFKVLPGVGKAGFNKEKGRWEEPCKRIQL